MSPMSLLLAENGILIFLQYPWPTFIRKASVQKAGVLYITVRGQYSTKTRLVSLPLEARAVTRSVGAMLIRFHFSKLCPLEETVMPTISTLQVAYARQYEDSLGMVTTLCP